MVRRASLLLAEGPHDPIRRLASVPVATGQAPDYYKAVAVCSATSSHRHKKSERQHFMPQGRILVTGASGMVGRHCLHRALDAGYEVRAMVPAAAATWRDCGTLTWSW